MGQNKQYGHALNKKFMDTAFSRYFDTNIKKKGVNFSSGNPAFMPFPPAITAAQESLNDTRMKMYGSSSGRRQTCGAVLPYCEDLGLTPKDGGLNEKNIIPGMGITHLYACIVEALSKRAAIENPGKTPVIVMTAPTYGMFTFQSEPFGFDIETIPLRKEDKWQTNADILNNKIKDINASQDRFVSAFYRVNPQNPLGTVEEHDTTKQIARVLQKNNVWGIDDLAYLGQEYRGEVVPLGRYNFDLNMSLFSLSKTYCMPGIRGGFMCAPKEIVDEVGLASLRTIQSTSLPSEAAMAASFGEEHKQEREIFIAKNNLEYLRNYDLLKALINGINTIPDLDNTRRREIEQLTTKVFAHKPKAMDILKHGVEGVEIVNEEMDSGYFAVLRIKDLDSLYYGTEKLRNSFQLATACVDQGHVLTLPMASSLAEEELPSCVRVSFGLYDEKIIKGVRGIHRAMRALTETPNALLQDKLAKEGKLFELELD